MKNTNFNIIFDLDGTLIHSVPDMHHAISKTLSKYKLKNISEDKLQTFVGEGMLSLSKKVVDFCGGDESLYEVFFNNYRQNYSEQPYKYSTLMPGVMETLNFFYERNILMGICTNKRQFVTEKLIHINFYLHHKNQLLFLTKIAYLHQQKSAVFLQIYFLNYI